MLLRAYGVFGVAVLIAASAPHQLAAQDTAIALGTTRVQPVFPGPTSCRPTETADTIAVNLYAIINGARPKGIADTAWTRYVRSVLDAVRRSFILPRSLQLAAFSGPFLYTVGRNALTDQASKPDALVEGTVPSGFRSSIDSSAPASGVLSGILIDDDNRPVPLATVTVAGTSVTVRSDSAGAWRMTHLFPGTYVVRAQRLGYAPSETTIALGRLTTPKPDTVHMTRVAIRLGAVSVEGRHQGQFVAPMMSTVVTVGLDGEKSLRDTHVTASSGSPSADSSVVAAVRRATAEGQFPAVPYANTRTHATTYELTVSMDEPGPGEQAMVVGELQVPVWPLAHEAEIRDDVQQPGVIDEMIREGARADTITLEFVVDERGHPIASTARTERDESGRPIDNAHRAGFERRVLQSLPQFSFEEARIGGCAVAEFVRQQIGYRVSGDQQ